MFENLSERLSQSLHNLGGKGRLSEDNIQQALRDVRMALLEADVALPVVTEFVAHVRERAVGAEVTRSLTPGQVFVRIVNDELVRLLGGEQQALNLRTQPPAVIMLAGLQGAGKTTSAAKLARYLKERERKRVLLASVDVYRPAAIEQLERLAEQVGASFFPSDPAEAPAALAAAALAHGRRHYVDVVIIDTAGRLHVDASMMAEAQAVHAAVQPIETLFVVDSMTGQDAAQTARAFDAALPLTGVILTKADGDARGGAALSIRQVTGKPIKFMGMGEKVEALEPFYPDRIASRILGMGDVLSLVEEVERKADKRKADKLARKLQKGKGISLEDYRDQLNQMLEMGGVAGIMEKLPGAMQLPEAARSQVNDREIRRMIAVINSMTPGERRRPEILKASRKQRVARGCGLQVQDVNRLLKQFQQTQKMMKRVGKLNLKGMLGGGRGPLPPGIGF